MTCPPSGNMALRTKGRKQNRKPQYWKNQHQAHALQQVVWAADYTKRPRSHHERESAPV
jgi:hypothetical protein